MNCYDQVQCEEVSEDMDGLRAAMIEDATSQDNSEALTEDEHEIAVAAYTQWLEDNPMEAQRIHDNHEAVANETI